jgi:signal transduction histidine kinase
MSKTSAGNSTIRQIKTFFRPFAALGTGLFNKYRFDIFFRTECNIIALQVLFSVSILAAIAVGTRYFYADISRKVVEGIVMILQSENPSQNIAVNVARQIEYQQTDTLIMASAILIIVTLIFSYVLARLTLKPTREALATQKRFIGNIAHELRTPLSIIKTNTEVRLLDPDVPAQARKTHESNLEELDRASEIINNLLTLNTLVRPENIEFKSVNLREIVEKAVRHFKNLAHKKNITIEMHTEGGMTHTVWGNATALEQIVGNLIKNALLYTRVGGSITILTRKALGGFIELSVQDTGIGIEKEDLDKVFEPFFQIESSRKRRGGGSGLGLAIVNELVRLHKGKIAIRSVPKRGTTVIINLPQAEEVQNPARKPGSARGEILIDFSNKRTFS